MRAWVAGVVVFAAAACGPAYAPDEDTVESEAAPIRQVEAAPVGSEAQLDEAALAPKTPRLLACRPRSCAELAANCGTLGDGCGGVLDCGMCAGAMSCDASNVCTSANARFRQISVGQIHACGVMSDRTLWCWGWNTHGQLGDGTNLNRARPVQVGRDSDWATVAAGWRHTCALKLSGELSCWGSNWAGELGIGSRTESWVPAVVAWGVTDWKAIAAGQNTTCGLRTAGTLWCWGRLIPVEGIHAWPSVTTPAVISSNGHWRELSVRNDVMCAIDESGVMACWSQYPVGDKTGYLYWHFEHEAAISGTWSTVDVYAGEDRCAVRSDGTLWCGKPLARQGLDSDWARLAGRQGAFCALRTDRSLWCKAQWMEPQRVGTGQWLDLAGYDYRYCGIRDDGSTWCWQHDDPPTQIHP